MTREINTTAAVNKFLAHISGDLGAYLEGCLHCGLCADACHFYAVTKDPRYTPAYKLFPMARTYKRSKPPLSWFGGAPKITEKDLQEWEELLFDSCTMCGRCTMVCPMGIDIASIVSVSRQAFVAAGLGPPDLLQAAENSRDKGSPLGVTKEVLADRVEWMEDEHEVDIPLDKESADILLTVSSIELMKYPESLVAMTKLLNHAGVNWTLSSKGYEATNFGFLSGKADVAKVMIERITTAAESIGAKTVIVPECGHAFGALRWSGANILGRPLPYEVMHITEYLADLKHHGKLKLLPFDDSITYHDPCQISRRGGATQAARDLLDGVANEIGKPVDRRVGIDQRIIVGSTQPCSDGVVGNTEVASRFRFVPATHGPQLQDGHPFCAGVLWSSVWGNSLHACAVDPQFLAEHGNFGFQLMDSSVFHVTVCDQGFTTGEHGDSYDADDVQHGGSEVGVPIFGKA